MEGTQGGSCERLLEIIEYWQPTDHCTVALGRASLVTG